jgi:hypothetical protein
MPFFANSSDRTISHIKSERERNEQETPGKRAKSTEKPVKNPEKKRKSENPY